MDTAFDLFQQICAICLGILLRSGPFLKEAIYQDLLIYELRKLGIETTREMVFSYSLIIAISAVLFVAFALGWFSHWLLAALRACPKRTWVNLKKWRKNFMKPKKRVIRQSPICNNARPN